MPDEAPPVYLHIGCGQVKLPGFINIDTDGAPDLRLDVRDGLPFAPGSVQGIYSEHFVEHLDQGELLNFLRDCRRVLAPGGRLRIATPDLAQIVQDYVDGTWHERAWLKTYGYEWIRSRAEYLNISMRHWGHRWLLDAEELTRLLRLAGFETIGSQPLGRSPDPMLCDRETREHSFVLEARKSDAALPSRPLVSIVIPAYKVEYLAQALDSALAQTYGETEVLVLDDSPNDRIDELVRAYAERQGRVRYVRNPKPLGEPANLTQGIHLAKGELIKPLYDDDVLMPEAVARLVEALVRHPEASLAVCRRLPIDAQGNPVKQGLPDMPQALRGQDVIRGDWVIATIAAQGQNWLGEPSVMLFRRAHALAIQEPDVMSLFGRLCYGIGDVCLAQHLLGRGDLAWIDEPLALFRLHGEQAQQQPGFRARALETWVYFRSQAARLGFTLPHSQARTPASSVMLPDATRAHEQAGSEEHMPPGRADGEAGLLTRIDSLASLAASHLQGRHAVLLAGQDALPLLDTLKAGEDAPWVGVVLSPGAEAPPLAQQADWLTHAWLSQLDALPRADIDAVVCAGHLESCPDATTELAFLHSRLDDAALTIFAAANAGSLERLDRLARGLSAAEGQEAERLFTLPTLQTLLEGQGFRVTAWYGIASAPFARGEGDAARHIERLDTGFLTVQVRDVAQQRLLESRTLVAVTRPEQSRLALEVEPQELYHLWMATHAWPQWLQAWMRRRAEAMPAPPHIHLGIIAEDHRIQALMRTLSAMGEQLWERWQISIVARNACPPALAALHPIVQWRQIGTDEDAVAALNAVLLGTPADLVGQIEAGDRLAIHALSLFADKFDSHPHWQAAYSDEDSLDSAGERCTPHFKIDFDIDALRAAPYVVGGLWLMRAELFRRLGGYEPELAGVEGYDLQLRAWEAVGDAGIAHVADVLYHRDPEGGHATASMDVLAERRRLALHEHLVRLGLEADIEPTQVPGILRLHYRHTAEPLVSLCIPTRNRLGLLSRCLESVLTRTRYPNYEIILVDNGSDEADVWSYYDALRTRLGSRFTLLRYDAPFNYAAMMNLAAEAARGEYLLHLNNDTAILQPDWLDALLGLAMRPDVGVVGPRLLYPDGRMQHAGCVLGLTGGAAGHPYLGESGDAPGYMGRLLYTHQVSAVTGACLLMRRDLYQQVGGMDAERLRVNFNDIDLCLKARAAGLRVLWTPHATLMHDAGSTRGRIDTAEAAQAARDELTAANLAMYDRWGKLLGHDPFYNRNLSLHPKRAYRIELAPALTWDPEHKPLPRVLAHPADRQGCGEYRIIAPMRVLNRLGRLMGWETGGYLQAAELARMQPDSIVLQRQVTEEQIQLIEGYRAYSQAFKVFEIDDLITHVPIKSPVKSKFVEQKDLYKRFRKAVGLCDRFVVSTYYLAEAYRSLGPPVVVVQNHLEGEVWLNLPRPAQRAGKPRVGWAGASQHHGDLAIVTEVIKATADVVDWVFLGMCLDEARPYVKELHPGVALADYPAKLASLDLDLAVAPLEDVPFNHAKSHLRLLEYGILGYPVVCTDLTPYRGDYPVTRVPNRFIAWRDAILERVTERNALRQEGERLREYIRNNWILEDHPERWLTGWLP